MFRLRIWIAVSAALCALEAAAAFTVPVTPTLRTSHDIFTGTSCTLAQPALLSLAKTRSALRRKLSATSLSMTRTNLVTFGDVWRETCEEEQLTDQLWERQHDEDEEDGVNPIMAAGSFVGSVATGMWDHLTADPSPEEVQASLAAFAKAHQGAVMTPMSESELEKELRFCGIFPDLVDTMIESELTQELTREDEDKDDNDK